MAKKEVSKERAPVQEAVAASDDEENIDEIFSGLESESD